MVLGEAVHAFPAAVWHHGDIMKRRASLGLSVLLLVAYMATTYGGGNLATSLAFTIPALAQDLTVVFMLLWAYRRVPVSQDDSWPAFWTSMAGTHLFVVAKLIGMPLLDAHPVAVVRSVCLVLLTSSYPLVIYTMLVLGRSFSVLPEAQRLVTVGPYRWSRHPLYVLYIFWYLMLVGIGQTWAVAALSAAATALQIARARSEERVLTGAFGEAYLEYRATTGWLGRRRAPSA